MARRKSAEACNRSRRDVARLLLAAAFALPLVACAARPPGSEGDPRDRMKNCIARLRRMGQFSAKLGGRCG
jgi:hypothetical protein